MTAVILIHCVGAAVVVAVVVFSGLFAVLVVNFFFQL